MRGEYVTVENWRKGGNCCSSLKKGSNRCDSVHINPLDKHLENIVVYNPSRVMTRIEYTFLWSDKLAVVGSILPVTLAPERGTVASASMFNP